MLAVHYTEGGALLHIDYAASLAVRAGLGTGAFRRTGAAARRAILDPLGADGLFAALGCFFKGQGHRRPHIPTARRRIGVAPTKAEAAASTAKDGGEDIAQVNVAAVKAKATAAVAALSGAVVGVNPGKAELVVSGFLLGIAQHLVGLVAFLEFGLGHRVVRVQVRVVLLGGFAVCFFDLILRGAFAYAQHLVVISFFFRHSSLRRLDFSIDNGIGRRQYWCITACRRF